MKILCITALAAGLCLASYAPPARAQATPPAPTSSLQNLYTVGVNASPGAGTPVDGSFMWAHNLNDSTGTFGFTLVDIVPATLKPFTVVTNTSLGVAQKLATIAGKEIYGTAGAGLSMSGTATGYNYNFGAALPLRYKQTNWYIVPVVRVLKTNVPNGNGYQPIFGLHFGWGQ